MEVSCQKPIQLANAPVNPGDYLIADLTGIVIIPHHGITDVLDAATIIARHEQQIADRIENGTPITEAMGRNYEQPLGDGHISAR